MKVLIDMNLSPLWVEALEEEGLKAKPWSDFSRLLALTRSAGPSVVQLRSQSVLPDQASPLVFAALRQYSELLEQGALVVIDAVSSRARILPIK